ncbi:MAG: Uma2 family endonuclease [Leptolyngbyaceae cyanobacterium]
MVQAPTKAITLDEFLRLPETKPASEFIDGHIIQKPMPQGKHSTLQLEFATVINTQTRPPKIARAFPELRCTFGGSAIVPDIAVFTWDRIPTDETGDIADVFPLAPDWTIEILSPGQGLTRVTKNILRCLQNGTEMGWLIDPEDRGVFIHQSNQGMAVLDEPEDILPMPSFMGEFTFRVGELFGLLQL